MSPGARKLALTIHLASSVGWVGAVVVYIALGVAAVSTSDAQTVRAAWTAMELMGWWVIVPLAVGALLTGLLMSLGTQWGLFRHYWTPISLVLTLVCSLVLIEHMPSVSATARVLREAQDGDVRAMGGDLFHPSVGLLVLAAVMVLNVYKPAGLTPYGWRKQQERRASLRPVPVRQPDAPRMPEPLARPRGFQRLNNALSAAGSFALYFVEMVFAMMVGMMVFVPIRFGLVTLGYAALLDASSVTFEAWMGTFMVAPMLAWMRIRGCNWREAVEMGAGMLLPTAAILFLRDGGLAEAMPWLAGLDRPAMLLGMVLVMLFRRKRYNSGYTLFRSFVVGTSAGRSRDLMNA